MSELTLVVLGSGAETDGVDTSVAGVSVTAGGSGVVTGSATEVSLGEPEGTLGAVAGATELSGVVVGFLFSSLLVPFRSIKCPLFVKLMISPRVTLGQTASILP